MQHEGYRIQRADIARITLKERATGQVEALLTSSGGPADLIGLMLVLQSTPGPVDLLVRVVGHREKPPEGVQEGLRLVEEPPRAYHQ